MKAKLVIEMSSDDDAATPRSFVIDSMLSLGRGPGNDIFIDDDQVSRNHALVRHDEGEIVILDLGSSNGTFVNDKPVSAPTPLKHNDKIQLGGTTLVLSLGDELEGSTRGKPPRTTRRVFASVNMAVLVSDVRNFTMLSETLPAEGLSAILADWFRHVGALLQNHDGNVEKIRGDSVLAYWPAAIDGSGNMHIINALTTACDMIVAAREFDQRMNEIYPGNDFRIGCAVHAGEAVLGNIGTDARRDYTTLGDCVNITFRIESLCNVLKRSILVSEEVQKLAANEFKFEDLGAHKLKGKPKPIRIFSIPQQ